MNSGDVIHTRNVRALLAPGHRRGGWIEFGAEKGEHLALIFLGRVKDENAASFDPVLTMIELGWTPPRDIMDEWKKNQSSQVLAHATLRIAQSRKAERRASAAGGKK